MYISLLCLLFICIQTFFIITFLWKHLRYSQPSKHTNPPSVSVVVASRNEENNLPTLIKSLLNQTYPNFEIIIVNDQSTDNSLNILNQVDDDLFSFINITTAPTHISSKKNALTKGIQQAKNEWILLTDADCVPASEHWITGMVDAIKPQTEIVIGVSPNVKPVGLLSKFIRFESFYTFLQYSTATLCNRTYMGVGRNLMYKKALFIENGFTPFEKVKSGDDDLFVNQHSTKKNTSISLDPSAYTYTYPEKTFSDYIKQKKRHTSVGKHYTIKSKILTGLFFLSFGFSYLALIFGLVTYSKNILILSILLLLLKQICFYVINKKRGFSEKNHFFIVYDFIYFLYLSYSFAINLRKTQVEWK